MPPGSRCGGRYRPARAHSTSIFVTHAKRPSSTTTVAGFTWTTSTRGRGSRRLARAGNPIEPGGGTGRPPAGPGFPTNPGDGCPTITARGTSRLVSAGCGPGEATGGPRGSTGHGGRDMSAGARTAITTHGGGDGAGTAVVTIRVTTRPTGLRTRVAVVPNPRDGTLYRRAPAPIGSSTAALAPVRTPRLRSTSVAGCGWRRWIGRDGPRFVKRTSQAPTSRASPGLVTA